MAINGRTFQLLYIFRELHNDWQAEQVDSLLDDDDEYGGATLDDVSQFIAARRKAAPSIYGKAYISPSTLEDMAGRMSGNERLLERHGKKYLLSVTGSAMADLLVDIDACSTLFLDNYKPEVCIAVLRQQVRLGKSDPMEARQVAAICGISLDSARRGLDALAKKGDVDEQSQGRTRLFSIPQPPVDDSKDEEPVDPETEPETDEEEDPIKAALADIDEDDLVPTPETVADEPEPEDEDDIVDRVLGDEPDEKPPLTLLGADDDFQPSDDRDQGRDEPVEVDEPEYENEDIPANYEQGIDPMPHDYEGPPEEDDTQEFWNGVPLQIRRQLYMQATAAGMSFNEFLEILVGANQERIQRGLFVVR